MFPKIIAARIRKTRWLHFDRVGFVDALRDDYPGAGEDGRQTGTDSGGQGERD